jgi:hypothetical protein
LEIRDSSGASKLRRTVADFDQRTFQTPLNDLPTFVDLLLAGKPEIAAATVTIEQVVFTPERLERFLTDYELPLDYRDRAIVSESHQESKGLLEAALSGWVDFYFVPTPRRFILYADHDEYATLFAARRGTLSAIAGSLTAAGFKEVPDYVRKL